jgi:HEPN domain-containing protein
MVSRYRDWLRQAERNLRSAHANFREGIYEEACFESHQAVEKALKALLNYMHRERRGYSLVYLASEVEVSIPGDIRSCFSFLDKHYILSRYPDVYDEGAPLDYYTEENARSCIECAEKIIGWVKGIVK